MRQPSDDRALYYRELRNALHTIVEPAVDSAHARDTLGLIDRILVEFIVEEESGAALSAEFGTRFREALADNVADEVTAELFHELRAASSDAARTSHEVGTRLAAIEHEFLEQQERHRVAVGRELDESSGGADTPSACSISTEQLSEYLRERLGTTELVVTDLRVVPGGRSKETILASIAGTSELPARVVVRKDRPVSVLPTVAAEEFEIIKAVHDYGGVPIPQPYLVERDPDRLGGTFVVMECVPGMKAGEYFPDLAAPPQHGRMIGLQLARGLARLHTMPLDLLGSAGLDLAPVEPDRDAQIESIRQLEASVTAMSGLPNVNIRVACGWLVDHVDDVVGLVASSLTQGDFGLHNMLIDGDRVTALVDWEAARIAPPVREMANTWNAVHALCTWDEFVTEYIAHGGDKDACDATGLLYYRVFGAVGAYFASRTGGHLFRTGAKRDIVTAHSGLDAQFRTARNLARVVAEALGT